MTSYFDFSRIGETFQNFTYELVSRVDTLGPEWLSAGIQLFVLFAIIAVIGGAAAFLTGLLDPAIVTRPLKKIWK